MARAHRLHYDSLETLLRIYRWLRLGKELRLYGKLKLELSQTAAIPFRTVQSLLTAAEIDLLCDDAPQADGKMAGAESLVSKTETFLDEAARLSVKAKSKRAAGGDSSPALWRTKFYVPSWMEKV